MHAREPVASRLADLARLLRPTPGRFELALRLALIAALTTLVCEMNQTFYPALAAYVLLFFNKPDRVTSLAMNIAALVAVTLLIALVFPLLIAVIDRPLWRMVSMTVISLAVLFVASGRNLQEEGAIIALIIAYALNLVGLLPAGELATRGLLYAWLIVAIPASVSIVVNLLLAPAPRLLAERHMAWRLRLAAALLTGADDATRRNFTDVLDEGNGQIEQWLRLAALEHTSPRADIDALQRAAQSTVGILALVDAIRAESGPALPAAARQHLAATLTEMAAILDGGGYPVEIDADGFAEYQALAAPRPAAALAELRLLLAGFAEADGGEKPKDADMPVATETTGASPKLGGESKLKALFTNPEHTRYAVKATGAAMFCYLLYSLLDWPGIHTCMITCYIVSLGTTAETAQKLTLRLVGCILGAILGVLSILYVVPSLHSVIALMSVVFVGMLGSAWIAFGSPRIAYAGYQIGFAFLLCVLQGWGPGFDMSVASDRIIGVLIGNLVVYVVFTGVWPVSVGQRIEPAMAAVLGKLGRLMTGADRASRLDGLAGAQAGLGAIRRDIGLIIYEPASVRPPPAWVAARAAIAERIDALQGLLLLHAQQAQPQARAAIGQRLERLAAGFASDKGELRLRASPPVAQPRDLALGPAITAELDAIEAAFLPVAQNDGGSADAVLA